MGKSNYIEDHELVRQIHEAKDVELFGILYDRYVHLIYHRCFSFVNNSLEAEDLTHDIFLKAYIKLNTFNAESKFSTWLYSLAINYCIDYNRKRKIETVEIDTSCISDLIHPDNMEETLLSIKAEKLFQILEVIPPEDKAILILKYQDDYSVKDLSELFKVGESAVKMRLSRAREKVVCFYKTKYEQIKIV